MVEGDFNRFERKSTTIYSWAFAFVSAFYERGRKTVAGFPFSRPSRTIFLRR